MIIHMCIKQINNNNNNDNNNNNQIYRNGVTWYN